MLRTVLSTLALAAILPANAPAEDLQPAPCHRATGAPRVVATLVTDSARAQAAIVACDRASGRRTVLRRGNDQLWSHTAGFVRLLGAPAAAGTTVTWGEMTGSERVKPGHWHQAQVSVDIRRPSVRRRRALGPRAGVRFGGGYLDTYAFPGGALAYMVIGNDETDGIVMLRRPHRAARIVATGVTSMQREGGRTLLWQTWSTPRFRPAWHALDVAPVARDAAGCPVRAGYRTDVDTPLLRVTRIRLFETYALYRACWKATGRDDIVASDDDYESTYPLAAGSRVLLRTMYVDKYQQCPPGENGRLVVLDARTRRYERAATLACADYDRGAFVFSGRGAPAWISADETGHQTLRTVLPDGSTAELDDGPAGSLAALATDGSTFTWAHDGGPRSAPVR
jgi:hypothetical protein